MTSTIPLCRINELSDRQFIDMLGGIYEHSPWVAEEALQHRPFDSLHDLQNTMAAAVRQASQEKKLQLIRNHPQLAGKEATQGALTVDSRNEQQGAGLDQCSAEELETINTLNNEYLEKFKFPFVIAVKGLDRYQITGAMQHRIHSDWQTEFDTSIEEICKIARIRLDALTSE